ncbi:hypothetical protein O1611_g3610 [Lasiodiplodia mahajangana]|uniref:Uncharacterized protein n=1 Tax=Lasiodiplodia mahajangana TaxID=1108764 RepID=A0ACC2JRW7_9PEZI|nr:hypothetical protein O1611_g3610 [Lasiodiplodia mahajangana]
MKELGLSVVYDPEKEGKNKPNVDVVLVHGFAGSKETYTYREGGRSIFWPKDLLPTEHPQARILYFGYDTGEKVVASIRDYARTMLGYLIDRRDGVEDRPIVFLGHCLGGLIIRQASKQCFALRFGAAGMFFGTPHGGGNKKGWEAIAKGYKGFGRKCKMIDVLAKNTDCLIEIDEDFCRLQGEYTIVNFYETYPLPGTKRLIVDKTSANKTPGVEVMNVDGHHLNMCQFNDAENGTFRKVCKVIRNAIGKATVAEVGEVVETGEVMEVMAATKRAITQHEVSYMLKMIATSRDTQGDTGQVFARSIRGSLQGQLGIADRAAVTDNEPLPDTMKGSRIGSGQEYFGLQTLSKDGEGEQASELYGAAISIGSSTRIPRRSRDTAGRYGRI